MKNWYEKRANWLRRDYKTTDSLGRDARLMASRGDGIPLAEGLVAMLKEKGILPANVQTKNPPESTLPGGPETVRIIDWIETSLSRPMMWVECIEITGTHYAWGLPPQAWSDRDWEAMRELNS